MNRLEMEEAISVMDNKDVPRGVIFYRVRKYRPTPLFVFVIALIVIAYVCH